MATSVLKVCLFVAEKGDDEDILSTLLSLARQKSAEGAFSQPLLFAP